MYQFVIAQPHSLLVLSLTVMDPPWLGWQRLSQIVESVWNIDNCHVANLVLKMDQNTVLLNVYTANVLTIKTTGTGNCGGPAGKICTIYGKGL